MKEYFITSKQETFTIELNNVIGKVVLLDTMDGQVFQKLMKTTDAIHVKLVPFGVGSGDEFELIGFTVMNEPFSDV